MAGRSKILVLVLVVLVATVAIYVTQYWASNSVGSPPLATVAVSGTAVTAEPGATALDVLFTDGSGKTFDAAITNGQYSVVLSTNQTYSVHLTWKDAQSGIPGYLGQCNEGSLTVPANPKSPDMHRDWSC